MPNTESGMTDDQLAAEMNAEGGRADNIINDLREPPEGTFRSTAFVEPFTWAWVGITLAEGAIAWVGGQMFARLFGGRDSVDIGRLVHEIVKAINEIVRHALDERDLRVLTAQLEKVQLDLLAYLDAPRGKDRLNFATDNSSSAMLQLKALDLLGHAAFMVAVGAHVAVLQERVRAIDRRDRLTIKRVLAEVGIPHAERMHAAWRAWHDSRYQIKTGRSSIRLGDSRIDLHYWMLLRDAKEIRREFYSGRAMLQQKSQTALSEDRERVWGDVVYPRYVAPSEEIVKKWQALADSI